jgi:hypothetical protein
MEENAAVGDVRRTIPEPPGVVVDLVAVTQAARQLMESTVANPFPVWVQAIADVGDLEPPRV